MRVLFTVMLLAVLHAKGQVQFQPLSLAAARDKAAQTGKLVFAQFVSAGCVQCNDVASVALNSTELGSLVNNNFIPIEIGLDYADRQAFIDAYNPTQHIGTFFISGDGELVHRYERTTTAYRLYIEEAHRAINKIVEGKATMAQLDRAAADDPYNLQALQKNLETRAAVGLPTDSLLDVFVQRLPEDVRYAPKTLANIATFAPNIFSAAHRALHSDKRRFNEVWYSLPLQHRVTINQKIISKSMAIAIKVKDRQKAHAVASFTAATYDQPAQKPKAFDKQMLNYWTGIQDTAAYLKAAVDYYDKYYMTVPLETIRRQDTLARSKAAAAAVMEVSKDPNNPAVTVQKRTFQYSPTAQIFSNGLNEGAWLLYTSTTDEKLLGKALMWAERAVAFFDVSPEVLDTYARLLYVTGNPAKAVQTQQKAVDNATTMGRDAARFEEVLRAMQKGERLPG